MKSSKSILLMLMLIFCTLVSGQDICTSAQVKQWVEQRFAKGIIPPFSFVYGGKKSDGFIRNWQYRSEKISSSETDKEKYVYSYSDKATGLTVKCTVTCFTDFPAVEWVLHFSNTSGKNTPLIENVAVADNSFIAGSSGNFILHHAKGSEAHITDFQPLEEVVAVGKNVYMTPSQGRSSTGAFPYFNIEMPGGQGIMVAVGWTGKWYADVATTDAKTVRLKSGMEKMQLALYPNEEIRTPKICLLFWKGENRIIGHNLFRQFMLAHHTPKINGKIPEYTLSAMFKFGDEHPSNCFWSECSTEEYCIAVVKRYQQYNIVPEIFWMDAGWYDGCGWKKSGWGFLGNWIPCPERFPNGLRPVADAVHKAGAKFMLWFDPERVSPGTNIDREYPDWLLKISDNGYRLFDLGNKDARIWLTDYITTFLKKEGVDYYRHDFNADPFPYWTAKDKQGRAGMSEIRYIEGLYAFWDSLLVRFPNLLIDNCASGGRRLDIEMMSRSVPLWRADGLPETTKQQCHTYALNLYLPIHGTYMLSCADDYTFRSALNAAAVSMTWLTGQGAETVEASRKYMQNFKMLRPYFYGDYYPLTPTQNYTSNAVWLAYQLNRPQEKDGIILAFRRADNRQTSIKIKLSGLEKDAVYELFYEDYGVRNQRTGNEMMNGFDITIANKPASLLIKYKKVEINN